MGSGGIDFPIWAAIIAMIAMHRHRLATSFLISTALLLAACATFDHRMAAGPPETAQQSLSEGYTLLHGLMEQESRLGGIFLIKDAPEEVEQVMLEIARVASDARDKIENFEAADEQISLEGANLPVIEAIARSGIERETTRELVSATGGEFHIRLIIEQLKATNYAANLARAIAQEEVDDRRRQYAEALAGRFDDLGNRLFALLERTSMRE